MSNTNLSLSSTSISSNDAPHIFWLFDWGVSEVYPLARLHPKYIRCQINSSEIQIESQPSPTIIQHSNILECKISKVFQGQYAGTTLNVEIRLSEDRKIKSGERHFQHIYIAPVHVFKPSLSLDDTNDMVTVINSYRKGILPTIPMNPYERELHRQGRGNTFSETKWNPWLSPLHYTSPPNRFKHLLIFIALIAIIIPVAMLLIYLVFWLLGWTT